VAAWSPDHPHARGENFAVKNNKIGYTGPSPRAWGKPYRASIPAAQSTDHPHARGENLLVLAVFGDAVGPSPRAWGKHGRDRIGRLRIRTIPTRVGKTLAQNLRWPANIGPSPRAWGKLDTTYGHKAWYRTIPTRVGKTCSAIRSVAPTADHPHARGENWRASESNVMVDGPSPRAWGKPDVVMWIKAGERTIPTRVGKTDLSSSLPRL